MSNKNLPGRALQIIYRYWVEHEHRYPASGEIAQALGISGSHWANLRKTMIDKDLLMESMAWGIELTDQTFSMMQANENKGEKKTNGKSQTGKFESKNLSSVTNKPQNTFEESTGNTVEIPLFGAVKAGIGSREDDLAIYDGSETITMPEAAGDPKTIFALHVVRREHGA
jgi:hypothetical protein